METRVVNRHYKKFDVYIGRGTPAGNKYHIGIDGDRATCIAKYKVWFYEEIERNPTFKAYILSLWGKTCG